MKSLRQTPILVTLPDELIERLQVFAKAGYRSRNKEILRRLEESCAGESIDEHGVIVRGLPARQK